MLLDINKNSGAVTTPLANGQGAIDRCGYNGVDRVGYKTLFK